MAKTDFDITALLGKQVSNLDTNPAEKRDQIEYIDIDQIDSDPNNFYELSGLDELASNIELFGLQQPIRVRANPEDGERVIIVSGHRRTAAIRKLVDGGRNDLREVACIRENIDGSPALQELRLIYANSDTRKLTAAEISKQAERVEMLLYQLKEEGYDFPGRMRDHVAKACQISAPKLARLKVIRENLLSNIMPAFEEGRLSEQAAYALARLPDEFQHRVYRIGALKGISGGYIEVVQRMYEDGVRWEPDLKCPDGKSCTHGDAFLRHDIESYERCKGEKCCLTCPLASRSWAPCERMCSKAKAQRAAAKAEQDAKDAKEQQKRTTNHQKKTRINAARLLPAIDAAGLSDKVNVPTSDYSYYTVGQIRKWAAGEFDDGDCRYGSCLEPDKFSAPIKAAKVLKCSADFLLGLSDELTPSGVKPIEVKSGVEWYPASVEPESGRDIVTIDDLGCADNGKYFSGGSYHGSIRWDEVVLWTYQPTEPTADALPEVPSKAGWQTGTPEVEGLYAAWMSPDANGPDMLSFIRWKNETWYFKTGNEQISANVLCWIYIPER